MANNKRIIVTSNSGTKRYSWRASDGEMKEDNSGTIGRVKSLEDAIAMAKSHAGV